MSAPKSPENLERELAACEARLAASPTLEILLQRATLLRALDRTEASKAAYLEAIQFDPNDLDALSQMGSFLSETNYRRAAIGVYRRILSLYPGSYAGHVNLANVLWNHGDHAAAQSHYEAALLIDPEGAEAHQGMAAVLMEQRQDERAWEHGRKGFAKSAFQELPYRGTKLPVSLLLLNSVAGGNIPLLQALDNRIFKITILATEFFDPVRPLPPHQILWNAIGEADRSRQALEIATKLLQRESVPAINLPERILRTGREENARRLSGIEGLILPKTARLGRNALEGPKGETKLQDLGLHFPILLRAEGFHAGKHFSKIDDAESLFHELERMPGDEFVLSQFYDSRGSEQKYRKYRVMMIDKMLYPLHAAISRDWKVHYFSADMAENPKHRDEDRAFLENMLQVLGPRALRVLEQIQEALGLDYAGIDFGVMPSGEILFFEANATMIVVPTDRDEKWAYRQQPVQRALEGITHMLLSRIRRDA